MRRSNGAGVKWMHTNAGHQGSDCLLWPYSCSTPGYGQFMVGKQRHEAHRYMCRLAHGEPPSSHHHAAHSCGNRRCVNPAHLSWKTPKDNQLDRPGQGRPFTGRKKHLKPADVIEIRRLRGIERPADLARRFGCTESNIRHIQTGATYRHVRI